MKKKNPLPEFREERERTRSVHSFSLPVGMMDRLRRHKEVNWSAVVANALEKKLTLLEGK